MTLIDNETKALRDADTMYEILEEAWSHLFLTGGHKDAPQWLRDAMYECRGKVQQAINHLEEAIGEQLRDD